MGTSIQRLNGPDGTPGTIIYFDTAESVTKNFPNKVTSHHIELGSPITDHIRSEPRTISVTALISDAALFFQEDDSFSEIATVKVGDSEVTRRFPIDGRSQKALEELEAIRDLREVFILETRNEVFENMVFTDFVVPRDSSTGSAARINFVAQEIRTVSREFSAVPVAVASDVKDKASETSETGRQSGQTPPTSIASGGAQEVIKQVNAAFGVEVNDSQASEILQDSIDSGDFF